MTCTHKLIVDRNIVGAGWLIVCTECGKVWGPYNYWDEADRERGKMEGKVKKQPPDLTAGEFNRREC